MRGFLTALISVLVLLTLPDQGLAQRKKQTLPKKAARAAVQRPKSIKGAITKLITRGNKKIEADAILAKVKSKVGGPVDRELIRQDVLAIYGMGYFYNVEVSTDPSAGGVEVTYSVTEKPSMAEIYYDGNDEINDDDIKEAAGLKAYEILDYGRLQEAVRKIQKAYEEKGYFLARVTYRVEDLQKGESVRVTFNVTENDKVKVKKFIFMGNRNIKDNEIMNVLQTKEDGFFSFLSGSGAYKQEAFDRDMQVIQYLYFNQGYVQVQIGKPEVTVTPDKRNIYISMKIEEGDQFSVGTVDFSGDLLYTRDELFESIQVDTAGIFSYETLQSDLRELQAKYGDLGYAFANIIPRTQVREKEKLVDITFEIDKGNKVYFNEINMLGNTKTRDKVIRRELEIREGELYNETRRRESLDKIKRLGYFEEVNFNTRTPPDKPDILDVDIAVKERNTGSIQVGAGFSSYQGFVFNGQLQQSNLFGKGQKLSASLDASSKTNVFRLSFTEPYFNDTEWSVGGDIYRSQILRDPYNEVKEGGAVRMGHPLAPYLEAFLRYKNDLTRLTLNEGQDPDLFPVKTANGPTGSLTGTIEYDKRDDRMMPSNGLFASLSLEYAGLGGGIYSWAGEDRKYNKGYANIRYYKKIFWDLVFRNNLNYAYIDSPNPDGPPFNELFLLGGANSLRGYRWFSIGKKKYSSRIDQEVDGVINHSPESFVPFGGMQQLYYNLEFEFPLITEAGIKGVVFYDIGNADDVLRDEDYRSNVGFGFRWFSPIGPLRFEWGFPIARKSGESATNFEFAIGSPF